MRAETAIIAISFLLYGLAFYNCYRVLGARHSPAASISWIWANLSIPIIGVPAYWLFGMGRLRDYPGYPEPKIQEPPLKPEERPGSSIAEFSKIFAKFGTVFAPFSCKVRLLKDGTSTFSAIFDAINAGRSYILVQYYILRSDRLGLELKELLISKAREGLQVYLLYDDMGSFWLSKQYIRDLRLAGVHTATFLPVFNLKRFYLMNYRNHRKLVVVDGHIAFTGGLNVGEEYAASRFGRHRYWRDTHMSIMGESAKQLVATFVGDWEFSTGQKILDRLEDPEYPTESGNHSFSQDILVVPSGPYDQTNIGMLLFMQIIHGAKKKLWVSTPYFVPDEALQKGLELSVLKGIEVKILLPKHSEQKLVHWVTLSYAEQMQRAGVQVYLYEKGFIHQKVILIDDDVAFVGTSNFDNRTLYLNCELMLGVFGEEFNKQIKLMLKDDFKSAKVFSPKKDRLIRKLVRLRANGARLLAPLL
ncbi:MAG: cardiolipin synthase [Oligoflexales bacterium]|nr:cardiolipin synthase [Oligoflexales bacterium]